MRGTREDFVKETREGTTETDGMTTRGREMTKCSQSRLSLSF